MILGITGPVLSQCQIKILTLFSHFCANRMTVESDLLIRDTPALNQDTPSLNRDLKWDTTYRPVYLPLETMVCQKYSAKGKKGTAKGTAKPRKEHHKIKWNPKSAHKGEKIQNWTEEDMQEALDLFKEGKLSQRAIARKTGIHVATLNKRFRGLVKGTGHWLGGNRSGKVLTYGT